MDPSSDSRDLGAGFQHLFELTVALDDASLDQVFRIRHDVYCRDLGWEPLRDDGRESDEFDRHSFHCLLRRRGTGEPVGCTRLILARPENPSCPLPFEESCKDVLDRSIADPARMPRDTLGEVSRLAVLSTFRQRKGEAATAVSITDDDFASRASRTRFPFIPVSLYLGAAALLDALASNMSSSLPNPDLRATSPASGSTFARLAGQSSIAVRAFHPCSALAR